MPKRTNEFQQLVDIIQRLYAPFGATVTASKMIETIKGEAPREIDVFVEYQEARTTRRVAVEARDLSRSLDVTQVECYIGKYNSPGGIVVDKVIIVAKSFTKTALKRAELVGFELHTLNSLEESVTGVFRKLPDEKGDWWVGDGGPRNVTISLIGAMDIKLDDGLLKDGRIVEALTGKIVGIPANWASHLLHGYLGDQVIEAYSENAGRLVHAVAELNFRDHMIGTRPTELAPLKKLLLDFGTSAKLPTMEAGLHELKKSPDRLQRIVQEKGKGTDSTIRIVYEEAKAPKSIQLQGFPDEIVNVTFSLEFDTVLARSTRDATAYSTSV